MYSTPGRNKHSHFKQLPEGPVADFCAAIEEISPDEWQKRSRALQTLIDTIPTGSHYLDDGEAWYNSAPVLRHLAHAISELLKDPRSTVVKRTCESLTQLFTKCQGDARYLFKDIMPTILGVHAQTVQIIRQAVQSMVLECIPEVPCKGVMPLWMERLKLDKSRTVRDACALYLGQALLHWTEEGYLTKEIWLQVGQLLVRSMRDPSPQVRSHAKEALERMQRVQPSCWRRLVEDDDNDLAKKDAKLQRWLERLGEDNNGGGGIDTDDLSVASKFSYNGDIRVMGPPQRLLTRHPSPRVARSLPNSPDKASTRNSGGFDVEVPNNISVTNSIPNNNNRFKPPRRGLGPPRRIATHSHAELPSTPTPAMPVAPGHNVVASIASIDTAVTAEERERANSPPDDHDAESRASRASSRAPSTALGPNLSMISSRASMGGRSAVITSRMTDALSIHSATVPVASSTDDAMKKEKLTVIALSVPAPQSFSEPVIDDRKEGEPLPWAAAEHPSSPDGVQSSIQPAKSLQSTGTAVNDTAMGDTAEAPMSAVVAASASASRNGTLYRLGKPHEERTIDIALPEAVESMSFPADLNIAFHKVNLSKSTSLSKSHSEDESPSLPSVHYIGSMQELKEVASKRRSRNSLLMQERFRLTSAESSCYQDSSYHGSDGEDESSSKFRSPPSQPYGPGAPAATPTSAMAPEHMVIAIRLLRAHKEHVDTIMETLRIEMDALRDFDRLLEEPGRPTEEEVLDYFESVGMCLDQRSQAAQQLQNEMDGISRGEPPTRPGE